MYNWGHSPQRPTYQETRKTSSLEKFDSWTSNTHLKSSLTILTLTDLNKQFTSINTLVQIPQSLFGLAQSTFNNGLLSLELILGKPLCQFLSGNGVLVGEIEDDETLHADAHGDDHHVVFETAGGCAVVVADGAAADEAGEGFCAGEGEVEDIAADVVEEDVDKALQWISIFASIDVVHVRSRISPLWHL